jgi:anti-sigma28 factor (negative regulator of flagellin synthesis)
MSDAHSLTGTNGSYGTAAVRAREQNGNSDEQARESRIAELRRQYLEGTYQVDARELSAALIRRHLAKDS